MDLIHRAQTHRAHFDPNAIQLSSLLSIKTGGCPEDCAYSIRASTPAWKPTKLMPLEDVIAAARRASRRRLHGSRLAQPKPHHLEAVAEMVSAVKALGMKPA